MAVQGSVELMGVKGDQHLAILCYLPSHLSREPDQKRNSQGSVKTLPRLAPTWHVGTTGGVFTSYVTLLVLIQFLLNSKNL